MKVSKMKEKEIKSFAKKIAKAEVILQTSDNEEEKKKAEKEILKLSSSIKNLQDMMLVDEYVQEILQKIFDK